MRCVKTGGLSATRRADGTECLMSQRQQLRRSNALKGVLICMALAALASGILLILIVVSSTAGNRSHVTVIAGGCMIVLIGAFWFAIHLVRGWQQDLQRLRGALLLAHDQPDSFNEHVVRLVESQDLTMLAETLDHIRARRHARQVVAEERLAAVLEAMPTAIVVITGRGLVSLVDAAAKQVLPSQAIASGTSIYAALRRESLEAVLRDAGMGPGPIKATLTTTDDRKLSATISRLGASGGFVLIFDGNTQDGSPAALEYDLALHDGVPEAGPAHADTTLEELPLLALDCETTGLDPAVDRVVSIGAVLAHGRRVFVHDNRDTLVKPDVSIPPSSTAIHGIDDAMVAGAGDVAEELRQLAQMAAGRVVLGHNIGFDLAVMSAEAARNGVVWETPLALDTSQLVAALEPAMQQLDLDRVAERFGVVIAGRHTALGDALVAADLFSRLIPLLHDRGVNTLGEAWAFSGKAKGLRMRQKQAGWHSVGGRDDG